MSLGWQKNSPVRAYLRRFCLLCLFCVLVGCTRTTPITKRTRILLGTAVTVKVWADNKGDALTYVDAAFREMDRIDSICGYQEGSDVARINVNTGRFVSVPSDVAEIVERSVKYSQLSNGALDVTIDPVFRLWHRFEGESLSVPSRQSIDSALVFVDYRAIAVEDSSVRVYIEGASMDLGAVAKGYAVDRGMAVLESLGASGGLIDAGGDIKVFGRRPDGGPWRIGLRDPRMLDSLVTVFEVANVAIATSGDYERYFLKDGVRYHHILDPATGFPARGCCSVTIITDEACDADAIATAVFVLGPEEGMKLIETLPDAEGLIIICADPEKQIIRSSGIRNYESNINLE